MAVPFYKKPIYVIGMAVGVAAIFLLTQPDTPPKKSPTVRSTTSMTTKRQVTDLLPIDYTAKLPPLSSPPANVFKPLVARQQASIGTINGALATAPGTIPSTYAGGEATWVYSGRAVVDGVPTALVENPTAGASVFLKQGERWKTCSVVAIKADQIVLLGPDGKRAVVKVHEDTKAAPTVAAANPTVNAPLVGDIGNPTATIDNGSGGNGGQGRRRGRGRRNQTDNGNANGF